MVELLCSTFTVWQKWCHSLICSYISNSEGYMAQIPQYPLLLQCLYRVCSSALHYGKVQPWHKALYQWWLTFSAWCVESRGKMSPSSGRSPNKETVIFVIYFLYLLGVCVLEIFLEGLYGALWGWWEHSLEAETARGALDEIKACLRGAGGGLDVQSRHFTVGEKRGEPQRQKEA